MISGHTSIGASIEYYIARDKMKHKKILCIDFDGVLHGYQSGWQGEGVINDPPVEGSMEWLLELIKSDKFNVCIYSSRSKSQEGIQAMKQWLKTGLSPYYPLFDFEGPEEITWAFIDENIEFPTQKPSAFLTIDDRCFLFEGEFPDIVEIENFMPWYCYQDC